MTQKHNVSLQFLARSILKDLKTLDEKIVFIESCTGGQLGQVLTEIPGASDSFCGSLVVYRTETKHQWLGISKKQLEEKTAVHPWVAQQMAVKGLKMTPEASLAVSITGYLGPEKSKKKEGLVYIGFARRSTPRKVWEIRKVLKVERKAQRSAMHFRKRMKLKASHAVLMVVRSLLSEQVKEH